MLNNLLVERSRKLVMILHRRKNKLRRSMDWRLSLQLEEIHIKDLE